jgi:hypothetical protein
MRLVTQIRRALLLSLFAAGLALAPLGCGGGSGSSDTNSGSSSSGGSSSGSTSGGSSGGSTSSSGGIPTGTQELPVAGQSAELVRYPFLQVADSPASIRIVWATASSGTSQVLARPANGGNTTTVTASQVQYATSVTGITTFYQQEALLTGLQPGTEYVYDIVHNGTTLARNVPFVTLKAASATSVSFIAFGDSGTSYSTPRDVRNAISSKDANGHYVYPHDFVVGVGDIAYNEGTYAEYNGNFFDQMSARGDDGDGARGIFANRLMRQKLAPILQGHGVQLAMFGHDHLYERSKRLKVDVTGKIVRGATCNGTASNVVESNTGIVYVVTGNGGDDLHHRQTDPTKVCGTSSYSSDVAQYGDGYDFVAMNGAAPVLFDLYAAGETPTSPAVRHGFTHIAIAGSQLTITADNYEGVVMDRYTMSAH